MRGDAGVFGGNKRGGEKYKELRKPVLATKLLAQLQYHCRQQIVFIHLKSVTAYVF